MARIYVIRYLKGRGNGSVNGMLVDFDSKRELESNIAAFECLYDYRRVSASYAHQWVRNGWTHSTGLWIDNGRVRYAEAQPN